MIRRGHDHDIGLLLGEEFAVITITARLIAAELGDLFPRALDRATVGIAHSDDLALTAGHGFADDIAAPPTGADECRAIFSRTFIRAAQLQIHRAERSDR